MVELPHRTYSRHTHVSLRNESGKNIFAVSGDELRSGRSGAANGDTKFISREAEMFLAGVLEGLPDGTTDFFFLSLSISLNDFP